MIQDPGLPGSCEAVGLPLRDLMRRYLVMGCVLVLVGAGRGWARPRFHAGNTGANPFETQMAATAVSPLHVRRNGRRPSAVTPDVIGSTLYLGTAAFQTARVCRVGGAQRTRSDKRRLLGALGVDVRLRQRGH